MLSVHIEIVSRGNSNMYQHHARYGTDKTGFRRAYFDGLQIVALSFIAEISFRFCCFVFDVNLLKVKFANYYAIKKNGL